jgi:predicted CXXCH cytochrome family protein
MNARALLICVPASAVILAAAAHGWQPAAPRYAVLYPPGRISVSGSVPIMVAGPRGGAAPVVKLDGRPVKLKRIGFADDWVTPGLLTATARRVGERQTAALWYAEATVKPGRRTLTAAGSSRALHVGAGAPKNWPVFHRHQPIAQKERSVSCSACHTWSGGALGRATMPDACAPCHPDTRVQAIHKHITPPLARCAMCHDPHGAVRAALLTDTKERLCSRCHAAGHSKG